VLSAEPFVERPVEEDMVFKLPAAVVHVVELEVRK